MRVAEDDDIGGVGAEHAGRRRAAELVAVADVNRELANRQLDSLLEAGVGRVIYVAEHGVYRRDLLQLPEDAVVTDVAAMKDERDAGQRRPDFLPELAVRVGYETDEAGGGH